MDNTHSAKTRAAQNARYEAAYGDPGTGRAEKVTEAAEKEEAPGQTNATKTSLTLSLSKAPNFYP